MEAARVDEMRSRLGNADLMSCVVAVMSVGFVEDLWAGGEREREERLLFLLLLLDEMASFSLLRERCFDFFELLVSRLRERLLSRSRSRSRDRPLRSRSPRLYKLRLN